MRLQLRAPGRGAFAALGFALGSLAPSVACSAADAPAWMTGLEAISRLADPLAPSALGLLGATGQHQQRCVRADYPRQPAYRCWAERSGNGEVAKATLDYAANEKTGPADSGTLQIELDRRYCATRAQAEHVFQRRFVAGLGAEPIAGAQDRSENFSARLFGDGMQPLTLRFDLVGGCIVRASLAR